MAIHLAALSWALIFILRLRFPPGKSIAKVILIFLKSKLTPGVCGQTMRLAVKFLYRHANNILMPHIIITILCQSLSQG